MSSIPGLRGGGAASRLTLQRLRLAVPALLAAAAVLGLAVACSPQESATATPPPSPTESGSPGPKPTSWPTTTVEAAIALGAAHSEFEQVVTDVAAAIDSEDPARLATVMGDVIAFLEGNQQNIPRLQAYPATKEVGDLLAHAYEAMIRGAREVRDGIEAGDAGAVEAGFTTYFEGQTNYVSISGALVEVSEQALLMKRQLLR